MAQIVNARRYPAPIQQGVLNADANRELQLAQFLVNIGQSLQASKDQKKLLLQENVALKEQLIKLPSTLQLELNSVYEDVMAKMHTISFEINKLIQTYTQFYSDSSPHKNYGAGHATKLITPNLETSKNFIDVAIIEEPKPVLKLEDVVQEPNQLALVEPIAVPQENAVGFFLGEYLQQLAEKIDAREQKVARIRADNLVLHKQIEALKRSAQNTEKEFRNHIWNTSVLECEANLLVLRICSIHKSIKDAWGLMPEARRERDKNDINEYVMRCKEVQTDLLILSVRIDGISKAIKGVS